MNCYGGLEAHRPAALVAMRWSKASRDVPGGPLRSYRRRVRPYSTDARWLVPHFGEDALDNAELVDLMPLVWQETKRPALSGGSTNAGWVQSRDGDPGGRVRKHAWTRQGDPRKEVSLVRSEIDGVIGEAPACSNASTT